MSIWKDNTAARLNPYAAPEPRNRPGTSRLETRARPRTPPPRRRVARAEHRPPRKESLIAADITIEGKIEGGGSVRIAGKFKGDVNVQGDLTIEAGAKLTGGVRADKVTIAGELEGNVEEASLVDLLQTRRGDRRPQGGLADGRGRRPPARPGRVRLGRRQGPKSRQARQRPRAERGAGS